MCKFYQVAVSRCSCEDRGNVMITKNDARRLILEETRYRTMMKRYLGLSSANVDDIS